MFNLFAECGKQNIIKKTAVWVDTVKIYAGVGRNGSEPSPGAGENGPKCYVCRQEWDFKNTAPRRALAPAIP